MVAPAVRRTETSSALRASSSGGEGLFSRSIYDTLGDGKIAVIPNFLPPDETARLRRDASALHGQRRFSTDALASYGRNGDFDPAKDRAVLRLSQWKDEGAGDWETRRRFGERMRVLREDLARNLNRPGMLVGDSVSMYGDGSTEISYTRFGPGAFLKRHVDEHHEELKGSAGWSKPTRRSVTWLVYLNEDWDTNKHGGCLRCFERRAPSSTVTGARPNGDLQIGWLRAASPPDRPDETPVFMDAQHDGVGGGANTGLCALYVDDPSAEGGRRYVSRNFHSHPTLYVGGSELLVRSTILNDKDTADRFRFIEPPKSVVTDWMERSSAEARVADERALDVEPLGGTLVLFDSVTLPHEVLPTTTRERWAASGWMHEDQQPVETHPHFQPSSNNVA